MSAGAKRNAAAYDLLEGVRVVELSMYAFVPSTAAVLAEWGADVIKVVPPKVADPMMGTPIAGLPKKDVGVAFMWEILNRGKRCIGVDVSTEDGRQVLLDLVATADVFVTNLLPGARARFRIDPGDLAVVNPALIYGRATGHGHEGPERDAGGYDHTDFWARTGIAHAASMVSGQFVPQPGPAMGDLSVHDPRFVTGQARLAHARECIGVLDEVFASRDLAEWLEILPTLTTPWSVVQTAGEAAHDSQVVANELVVQVEERFPLVRTPAQFDGLTPQLRVAPGHGEHTDEILLELGRSWEDILELKARDAVL